MNKKELSQKIEDFILYLKTKKASDDTIRVYTNDLEQFAKFTDLRNNETQTISTEQSIVNYLDYLKTLDNSPSSKARKFSCFNSFKRFLIKTGTKIDINIIRPATQLKNPIILTQEEICALLDSTKVNDLDTKFILRDKAIVELLYATGLRCNEITKIEIKDINILEKTIIVRTRNKKERIVIFGQKSLDRLNDYLNYERIKPENNNEKFFLNYKNQALTARSIQRICVMFSQLLEPQKNLSPSILRNSFAAHLLKLGASIETVQELLGHKLRSSTERYYECN